MPVPIAKSAAFLVIDSAIQKPRRPAEDAGNRAGIFHDSMQGMFQINEFHHETRDQVPGLLGFKHYTRSVDEVGNEADGIVCMIHDEWRVIIISSNLQN